MKEIIVLGSLNMDLVITAKRAPAAGETLPGKDFQTIPGGKGANQAAAAGRLGGTVFMVGRTGADAFGERLGRNLQELHVDTSLMMPDNAVPTGVALIIVEDGGENRILIVAGANGQVDTSDIGRMERHFEQAGLLIMQLEIPIATVEAALEKAFQAGVPVLLNPAPAYPIPPAWLPKIRYLVVNETEARVISGMEVTTVESAQDAASALQAQGVAVVLLTLGSRGAVVASGEGCWHVPAFQVNAIDTTAAGDAFIGGFAVSIISQLDLKHAVRFGNAAGALATTKLGAQTSLPSREEVEMLLNSE